MSSIEYYYPLTTLNVRTDSINNKKYFDVSINTLDKLKTNFAIVDKKNVMTTGSAIEYYIQSIVADAETAKIGNATKYLVIKHKTAGTCGTGNTCSANCEKISESSPCTPKPFYVAVPLYIVGANEDISTYIKSDRMNGRLAQSFDNLTKATKSVQFSLESVINSMKSFAPTGYYELTVTGKKIYVLDKPIYLKNINTASFYGGDIAIPSILGELIPAPVNRVKVTRTCTKPKRSKKVCKSMFYGLAKKEQVKIDYLNLIYGLVALICTIVFYYIYKNYLTGDATTVIYGLLFALAIVVLPIGITKGVYEGKTGNVNVSDLKHSIIFARYFILFILSSIVITFGLTDIKKFFTNNFNYAAVRTLMRSSWTKEKVTNLFIFIGSLFLISSSIYIFTPSPNECLL